MFICGSDIWVLPQKNGEFDWSDDTAFWDAKKSLASLDKNENYLDYFIGAKEGIFELPSNLWVFYVCFWNIRQKIEIVSIQLNHMQHRDSNENKEVLSNGDRADFETEQSNLPRERR